MYTVIKNVGKLISAWQLAAVPEENDPVIRNLIQEGRIRDLGNGNYEVMSQEVLLAAADCPDHQDETGEKASAGDYIKVDSSGNPYPNDRAFFEANHKRVVGQNDIYEQIPTPLRAWDEHCGDCKEIRFLVEHKGLRIDASSRELRYKAPLWGTIEVAAADAMIVFYSITYDENGMVLDADYNFVAREEFDKSYRYVDLK